MVLTTIQTIRCIYQFFKRSLSTSYGSAANIQYLDNDKKRICEAHGITLIAIPYWWDRKVSSLAATIAHHRPDMIEASQQGTPIPVTLY